MIDPINPITRKKAKNWSTYIFKSKHSYIKQKQENGGGGEGIQYIKLAVPMMKVEMSNLKTETT